MYFKGVQVHNVLVLECVTLETCTHSNLVGLQAYISSSFMSLLLVYELQWLWRDCIEEGLDGGSGIHYSLKV